MEVEEDEENVWKTAKDDVENHNKRFLNRNNCQSDKK